MEILRNKQIIVEYNDDYTSYWDATTPASWAVNSLAILTQRWEQGHWYQDPDDDGLGSGEWAEKRRQEFKDALALGIPEIEKLPKAAQETIFSLRKSSKRESRVEQEYRKWYEEAKKVVETQDSSSITVGRNRYERQVPKAWWLLEARSDGEYERVSLEDLQEVKI